MSRAKAFWLGLGCTLAVLLPIYLAVAAVIFTRSAPADTVQSGVPIAQPTLGDEKNFLLMTGPEQPETFVLLRFDALEGNLCSVAIRRDRGACERAARHAGRCGRTGGPGPGRGGFDGNTGH